MYNSIQTLCALACLAGLSEGILASSAQQEPVATGPEAIFQDLPPIGYGAPAQMASELRDLASNSGALTVKEIGKAPTGQSLSMATFKGSNSSPGQPELLIVANLEGDRPVASEVAMGIIRRLAKGDSPLLEAATVHVLPVANPDGAMHALVGGLPWRGSAMDEDRDGRMDEDGPMDLDGDGKVLWLRVPSNSGAWHASESDARCSIKAKHVREHAGAFHLRREGMDVDGDRVFSEDPQGGVSVDANFAHRWEQYAPAAGAYPLSEPESRALAKFLIDHPSVACVLVLDDEDNLSKPSKGNDKVKTNSTEPMKDDAGLISVLGMRLKPKKEEGKKEKPDETPAAEGDVKEKSNADESKETEPKWTAPRTSKHGMGNFADWAYFQRGALVLESAVWSYPLNAKGEGDKALPNEATEEEKLLAWSDRTYGAAGFQPWTPFVHGELGSVEIGGFMPLMRKNPPAVDLPGLVEHYSSFVESLAADFARIEWSEVSYMALDDKGVFDIRAKLVNRGRFATTTAMGDKNRAALPVRVALELPEEAQLLVGRSKSSVARLTGFGGSQEYHWIVKVPPGAGNPKLVARSTTAGEARLTLEVK
ncbi:MAG: hypothetical protein GY930_08050 [bacterium]|nr:hypothetical protein [bacterium]